MKARHAKKLLANLLRTHITVVPKDSALLIHLPLEAADYAEEWGKRLAEIADLLGVRVAAVMGEENVTVISSGVTEGRALEAGNFTKVCV